MNLTVLKIIYLIISVITISLWVVGRKYVKLSLEQKENKEANYKKGKYFLFAFGGFLIVFVALSIIILNFKK